MRIRDLYGELEKRLEPLEQQAGKAKKFLHLRDELRVLEVSLWLLSLEQLKNDTAKLNKDRTTCEKQLADAKQQQGTLYAQSEQLAESLREIDRETERLRNKLRIHALHLLSAVCALLPCALDILLAVADVRLNNRLTADLLGGKLLGFAQLVPQTFGFPVNLTQ